MLGTTLQPALPPRTPVGTITAASSDRRERFLRLADVSARVGLARSTIYRAISDGLFPAPIPILGANAVAWLESDIQKFIDERIAAHRGGEAS